jgi:hypothetical protein
MNNDLKKMVYGVIGRKNAMLLRVYSPHSLVRALVARSRYGKYKAEASRSYKGLQKEIPNFDRDGIVPLKGALAVTPEFLNQVYQEFETGDCVSFKGGIYQQGIDKSAEYTFLSKNAILRLGIPEMVLKMQSIHDLEAHLGTYMRIVNLVVFKTYPKTYVSLGSFLWHRDSQPSDSYKAIIYLTPVGSGDGAFQYMLGTHKSYSGLPQFGNSRRSDQSPKEFKEYLGEPGDGVLFDINGFHKGGTSDKSVRIVCVVHMKPSKIPCAEHLQKYGFGSVQDGEFGMDPNQIWWNRTNT